MADPTDLNAALAGVELLVLDFDGVLTDNRVLVDQDGREAVFCHRGDGWGIARVREAGVEVFVLSTETNPVVAARCRKLKIECIHGSDDKLSVFKQMLADRSLSPQQVVFMGNDVNDLQCLEYAGIAVVPADAEPQATALADLATDRRGGYGAVRQLCDRICAAKCSR